jgi:SAM-dependent methyltransferase
LQRNVAKAGLGRRYTILPYSVVAESLQPELEKCGVFPLPHGIGKIKGVFDTIICIRVLCSVPEVEKTAGELYDLLRPGGKLLVVEHVVNPWTTAKCPPVSRVMQGIYHALGWRWVVGNCCLTRDLERVIRYTPRKAEDEGWESVDAERWFESTCFPFISGAFVKRKD